MGQSLTRKQRNQSSQLIVKEDKLETISSKRRNKLILQELQISQGQLAASNGQVTDLQRQLAASNEQIYDLQRQLTASNQQVTALHGQLAANDQQFADFEQQMTERDQQISDLQGELRARDRQVSDLQRERRTRDPRRIIDLLGQLRTRDQQVRDLERQGRTRDRRVTALQRQLTASNEQVTDLERQVDPPRGNRLEIQRHWEINRNEIMVTGDVLGQGAWGTVFRGKFRRCDVAVKQIYEAILSPHNRTAFEREVGIASRCRHPCLLQFIGATNDEEGLLLVTELMDRSLRSLYEESPLTQREISVISLDVAQALNYLHQIKPDPIIHRDVSSANVLLWRQGDDWRGKVSDYGTANFVRQCRIDDLGAAIYCAPEAFGGAQDQIISCKVDVYSFGVILCEMCVQELPDPKQRETQISRMEPNQCRFLEIVVRCVQIEPGTRPNMEEIIDDLDEYFQPRVMSRIYK